MMRRILSVDDTDCPDLALYWLALAVLHWMYL